MASSSFTVPDSLLPMNTLLHLTSLKLTSTNYLVWRNTITPIFAYQKLLSHVDGSSSQPPATIVDNDKQVLNPELLSWTERDQRAIILINSSLSEEAATEVLGLTTARQIWVALETAYSNPSVERAHSLRDSLHQLLKGTSSVPEYSRKFKFFCDQLAAIGQPVNEPEKLHWFLRGLGPSFETFSISIKAIKPPPAFRDLLSQAESHELFLQSLHSATPPAAAFNVQHNRSYSNQNRGRGHSNRGGSNHSYSSRGNNSGRGSNNRSPHCQLCRTYGHYASSCPEYSFAKRATPTNDDIAKAFHAQCHVTNDLPDWTADSGDTAHMTPDPATLHHRTPYQGPQNQAGTS